MKAMVRHNPAWPKDRATEPLGLMILVDVTKTMTAKGTKITAMVLN